MTWMTRFTAWLFRDSDDPYKAGVVKANSRGRSAGDYYVSTWMEQNSGILNRSSSRRT